MLADRDAQAVLSFYALAAGSVRQTEPLGNAGGWSGSRLWRVTSETGEQYCLRQWPADHPTPDRLRLIHAVLSGLSREMPIVAFPLRTDAGTTFVDHAGHLWELTNWLPGVADYHSNPNRQRLAATMHALARFHILAARYQRRIGAAPAVVDRQRRLLGIREKGLARVEPSLAVPLGNAIDSRAAQLLNVVRTILGKTTVLDALAAVPELSLQPAIRDIHHDHVLFTGDEVTGIIDFGAMKIDTPLADIARLVGSLVGDDHEARQFALGVYSQHRPLSDLDRRLIDVFDESGLIIGALNWLVWLYADRRDMGPIEPILRRLDELLRRLESRIPYQN